MSVSAILITGACVLGAGICSTYLLPAQVHVERTAVIEASPGEVLALAASREGFQRFNPYLTKDPALKIDPFGPLSGVGSGFRFEGKDGKGTQTVAAVTADSVTYDIDLGAMGRPTQKIQVVPVEGGSQVTWSVDTDMGMNPVFRVFGLFMDGMMGGIFDQGLNNLAKATA